GVVLRARDDAAEACARQATIFRARCMGARMRRDQMYGGDVLTRRRLLELWPAGGAGAAVVRPRVSRAADPVLERRIPSSGEMLPAVGVGTWRAFDVGKSDQGRGTLQEAR